MRKVGSWLLVFLGLLLFGLSAGAGGAMVAHWLTARGQPPDLRQQNAVMGKAGVHKVLRAQRFEMVDSAGKARAATARCTSR
jgi:hypothetical protein